MEKIKKRLLKTKTSSTLQINELSLDLEKKGVLKRNPGKGRSISYALFKDLTFLDKS